MAYRSKPAWQDRRVVIVLTLVFLCGAAAGALTFRAVSQRVSAAHNPDAWNATAKQQTIERLKRDLDLTPQQVREIETILDDFSLYYQMLHAQMEETMTFSKSRIDQLLNEEQRKKFARIMSELKGKHPR